MSNTTFIFLIILFVFALFCTIYTIINTHKKCTLKVNATIIGLSDVDKGMSLTGKRCFPKLEYYYNGIRYENITYVKMKELIPGTVIEVYIDPNKPGMLYHESSKYNYVKLVIVCLVVIAVIVFKRFHG